MAVTSNIIIEEGEDVVLSFSPSTAQGATNITGWTLVYTMADDHDDDTTKVTVSGAIVSAAAGTFTVTLTSAQTDLGGTTEPTKKVWDVRRTNSGFETCLAKGSLTINPGVRL
jgi:hypothetical protein